MPGTWTSIEYCALPLTFCGSSIRIMLVPMRRNCSGFLSSLSATSGALAGTSANAAISP